MKNVKFLKLFLFILSMTLLISCSKEDDGMIYDYAGINIHLKIRDAQGRDLLNPDTPNNLVNSDQISFLYEDNVIPVTWDYGRNLKPESRLYMAYFNWAYYHEEIIYDKKTDSLKKTGEWIITLEDFNSIFSYDDEVVIIKIGEKSYHLKITNVANFKGHTLIRDTHIYVDGIEQGETDEKVCIIY